MPVPVEPERNLSDDLELVDRGWYVVQWDDVHLILNYVCQLIRQLDPNSVLEFTVNSYKKVMSGKNAATRQLFKKYPEEEIACKSQFKARLITPEFKPFGCVHSEAPVKFYIKSTVPKLKYQLE